MRHSEKNPPIHCSRAAIISLIFIGLVKFSDAFSNSFCPNSANGLHSTGSSWKKTKVLNLNDGVGEDKISNDFEQKMSSFVPDYSKIKSFDGEEIDLTNAFGSTDEDNLANSFFQFDPFEFPDLPNSEVYHSGSQREFMWLQNRESVAIYIPLDDPLQESEIQKSDIEIKFEKKRLDFFLGEAQTKASGKLYGEINPENSYWTFEAEQYPRFVNIQLEKKSEFDNWEKLFLEQEKIE